jgi:hypothetical protein
MKNQEIKVGKYNAFYPIENLKQSLVNRDIVKNHSDLFSKKISEYGWMSPIIIDDNGNIIEGHHRALSAEKLQLKTVPAYIVDWVDTNDLNEYQKCIINLNNSNRKWGAIDYLKSFSRNKEEYLFVFKKFNQASKIFSVGNVLNIYFNCGTNQTFKDGNSKIKDKEFSDYLFNNFLRLKSLYGGVKFQAFTINRVCSFVHQKIKGNKKEMEFLFKQLESLAKQNSPLLSSVEMIRPWLNEQLGIYRTK